MTVRGTKDPVAYGSFCYLEDSWKAVVEKPSKEIHAPKV
jgi:hypothetical protein